MKIAHNNILLLIIIALIACLPVKAQYTTISGSIEQSIDQKISLYGVNNGRLSEIATIIPNANGKFGFRFIPTYEGVYVIGTGDLLKGFGKRRFYFKGNENIDIKLLPNGYILNKADYSPETKILYKWDQLTESIRNKSLTPGGETTYKDFFPEIEVINHQLSQIKKSSKTGNKQFDDFFQLLVDYDLGYYAQTYLIMPRKEQPNENDKTDYYKKFNPNAFLTDNLLKFQYGDDWLLNLISLNIQITKAFGNDAILASIPSDVLKGQYLASRSESAPSYDLWKSFYDRYKPLLILPEQLQRVEAVGEKLLPAGNSPAIDFSFPDATGKKIGLKDFKGKLVLLDLWATWCGPCRDEEPHWEKLNEEYKGKDIVFVGISSDSNISFWEKYIVDKKIQGIQLIGGPGNELLKGYNVKGIPQYILIDKNGGMIDVNCPRPSNPKLRTLIDENLVK